MQDRYRIDLEEPGMLESRTSRWLKLRICGLLSVDSRLTAALTKKEA